MCGKHRGLAESARAVLIEVGLSGEEGSKTENGDLNGKDWDSNLSLFKQLWWSAASCGAAKNYRGHGI